MQGDTSRDSLSEHGGQWLLALMVIAATAVIVVSLFALARMTGVIPHAGVGQHEAETARDKARRLPKDRDDATPQDERPTPATQPGARPLRRVAEGPDCGARCSALAQAGVAVTWTAPSPTPHRIGS